MHSHRFRVFDLSGVFLIAASMVLLQVALTKFFSFRLWYHYAFMIISITMLGLGGSGSFLAIHHQRFKDRPRELVLWATAVGSGLSTLIAVAFLTLQTHVGVASLSGTTLMSFVGLATYWMVLFFPFFFSGCAISFALASSGERAPRVYAADLLGAAAGCLMAVLALSHFLVEQTLALAALLAFIGAGSFALSMDRVARRWPTALALVGVGACLFITFAKGSLFGTAITETKGLYGDLRVGHLVATRSGINGRVDVVSGSLRGFAWGISTLNPSPVPQQLAVRIDGDALTMVTRYDGDFSKWDFTNYMPSSLPYAVSKPARVLVIGVGGGMDVVNALGRGAVTVTGLEINSNIIELMHGPLRTFSGGIYDDPRVNVIHTDARSYVERATTNYDLIQLTLVDTFAAIASGALALSEDFLYTHEAFAAYISHLSRDGVLALGRTPGEAPGLVALVASVTSAHNIDLTQRIFIARNPTALHGLVFLYKNSPFTREQVAAGLAFVRRAGFTLQYAPGFERLSNPGLVALIQSRDWPALIRNAERDLRPETDDSPFYFRSSKWTQILGTYGGGRGNLLIILSIAVVFGFAAIIMPLLARARLPLRQYRHQLLTFVAIGFGYIMIEMVLLMKFSLFLGHPVYSLTVTLFALLLCSGLGSALCPWLVARGQHGRFSWQLLPFAGIALLGVLYWWGLSGLLRSLLGLEFWARVLVAGVLIAPLGLCMGMPFPVSLRALASGPPELVYWAWGVNGIASVVGSVAVILIAQDFGYDRAFLVAIGCYVVAALCVMAARPARGAES